MYITYGNIFFGLQIFHIFFGVLDIPDIYYGKESKPTYEEKMSPRPPWETWDWEK